MSGSLELFTEVQERESERFPRDEVLLELERPKSGKGQRHSRAKSRYASEKSIYKCV